MARSANHAPRARRSRAAIYIERQVQVEDENGQHTTLALSALRTHRAYVLLGDPGAGKTRAMWHEAQATSNGHLVRATHWLDGSAEAPAGGVPFIDALDEARASGGGADGAMGQVIRRLRELRCPRFRLSCRAADWFEHRDRGDLQQLLGPDPLTVAWLQPMRADEQLQLVAGFGAPDPQTFVDQVKTQGLAAPLDNPMTTELLVAAWQQGLPGSKQEVYALACAKLVKEANPEHHRRAAKRRPFDAELIDAAGALCAALLLSAQGAVGEGVGPFASDVIDLDALPASLPAKTLLSPALGSRLFSTRPGSDHEFEPVHRTVAEYLAACHIGQRLKADLPVSRVLSMLAFDGRVVTSLRGLNAWLATLCVAHRQAFIQADAMGVALYADVSQFTTGDKQAVFECLAREAEETPHFRAVHGYRAPSPGLAGADMAGYFAALITQPAPSPAQVTLLGLVFDTLGAAGSLLGMTRLVASLIGDTARPMTLRESALHAWLAAKPSTQDAQAMLDRLAAQSPTADALIEHALIGIYPSAITLAQALHCLPVADNDQRRIWRHRWERHVAEDTQDERLREALQAMLDFPERRGLESPHGLDRAAPELLLRLLTTQGDQAEPEQLLSWLSAGLNPRQQTLHWQWRHHGQTLLKLQQWLTARPWAYKAIASLHLARTPRGDDKAAADHLYALRGLLLNAPPPADFGRWALDQARDAKEQSLLRFALEQACAFVQGGVGNAGLDLDIIDEWCGAVERHWPDVKAWRDRLLTRDHDSIVFHQQEHAHQQQRQKDFESRRSHWLQPVRAHFQEMPPGDMLAALQIQLAMAWDGHYMEIVGDSGDERLRHFLADDQALIADAKRALRQAHHRSDLPSVSDILAVASKADAHHAIAGACSLSASLEAADDAGAVDRWPDELASKLTALHLAQAVGDEPAWHAQLVDRRHELVAEVYLQFFIGRVRAGRAHVFGSHRLTDDAAFAPVAAGLMLPLLQAWPTRTTAEQARLRREVHDAAWAYLLPDDLLLLAEQRLAARSLEPAQRLTWLAVQAALPAPQPQALPRLLRSLEGSQSACDELVAQLALPGLRTNIDQMTWPDQSAIWQCLARLNAPMDFPRDPITGWLNQLARDPGELAAQALDHWLADPALSAWHTHAKYLRYEQRALARDSLYRPPSLAAVVETLAHRAPASAADLQAMAIDMLGHLQADITGLDGRRWRNFWHSDPKSRQVTEPQPENDCRDEIKRFLVPRLNPLNVTIEPEAVKADERRCDLQLGFMADGLQHVLPIEIKRAGNKHLWTAIKSQLIDGYTTDPRSSRYGIYLVLWFGTEEQDWVRRHPDRLPIPNAEALRRLLDARLVLDVPRPSDRHRIKIVVLDVSARGPRTPRKAAGRVGPAIP